MRKLQALLRNKWAALIIATGIAILCKPLGFIYLLFIPFILTFKITRRSALVSLPLAVSLNALLAMINSMLIDTVNIPLVHTSLILLTFFEAIILLYFSPAKVVIELSRQQQKYMYAIYGLFGLAILSRLISVIHLQAPILHDPQAHAFWANRIANEHAIDYFYSPGLHIWSWLMHDSFSLSLARSVHVLTNFFSAFSVLAWALAAYIFTKKGRIALWTGLLALVAPLPQFLYFMAGKNSFVMSVSMMAITAIFCLFYYQRRSAINFIFLFICLTGVGIIHYPAYAYVIGTVFLYYLISYISDNHSAIRQNVLKHGKNFFMLVLPGLLSLVIIGVNIYLTTAENPKVTLVSSRSEAKAYHDQAKDSTEVPVYKTTKAPSKHHDGLANPVSATRSLVSEYVAFSKSFPKDIGLISLGATLAGLFFLLASTATQQQKNYSRFLLSTLLATYLVLIGLTIYPLKSLDTTRDTGILLLPLLLTFPLAWLLASIGKRRLIAVTAIAVIALTSSYLTYSIFRAKSATPFVDKADIQAFDWINDNLPDSEKFVGMSQLDPRRNSIVFPVDGTMWLPVFTNNAVATPFQEFSAVTSHINYEYTRRLSSEDPEVVKKSVEHFVHEGFRYLYVDGTIGRERLNIDKLIEKGHAQTLYNKSGVRIVKLTGV